MGRIGREEKKRLEGKRLGESEQRAEGECVAFCWVNVACGVPACGVTTACDDDGLTKDDAGRVVERRKRRRNMLPRTYPDVTS